MLNLEFNERALPHQFHRFYFTHTYQQLYLKTLLCTQVRTTFKVCFQIYELLKATADMHLVCNEMGMYSRYKIPI